jgi:hypothetical protein
MFVNSQFKSLCLVIYEFAFAKERSINVFSLKSQCRIEKCVLDKNYGFVVVPRSLLKRSIFVEVHHS